MKNKLSKNEATTFKLMVRHRIIPSKVRYVHAEVMQDNQTI